MYEVTVTLTALKGDYIEHFERKHNYSGEIYKTTEDVLMQAIKDGHNDLLELSLNPNLSFITVDEVSLIR